MIIDCINCNKKFNVDPNLIPYEGRQIQCGSCNHTWHYTIKTVSSNPLILASTKKIHEKKEEDQKLSENDNFQVNKQSTLFKQNIDIKKNNNKIENKSISRFFSYLVVLIISFVSLLILIDTVKSPLIDIFPQLEIVLFNLFETLKDVKLFIIDLT